MEVKVTGHSHSARNTLHYIFYGSYDQDQRAYNEAKANANGIHKRNELVVGYNCHNGYKHALKDFDNYLKMKPKNKVQTLNVVLSFAQNDFNFRKPEDCYEASTIARHFMKKAFPNHQAIIALQQDNQRGIPHIHLIICALSMQPPYKTIPGGHSKDWYQKHLDKPYQSINYGIEHLRHIGKECLNEYENDFNRSLTGLTQRGQSTTVGLNHIQKFMRNAVSSALSKATNKQTFRKILNNRYGVNASFKHHKSRRRRKRGRRSRQARYKRDGVVFRYDEIRRDKSGNIMYRKNRQPRVHRHYLKSSTLARFAPKLSYKNIFKTFRKNQQRQVTQTSLINKRNQFIQNDSDTNAAVNSINSSNSLSAENGINTKAGSASSAVSSDIVPTLQKTTQPSSAIKSKPVMDDDTQFSSFSVAVNTKYRNAIHKYQLKSSEELNKIQAKSRIESTTLNLSHKNVEPYNNLDKLVTNNMKKLSVLHQQAMPIMSKVYQTEAFDRPNGLKEFHIVSNVLSFDHKTKSISERIFGWLRDGIIKFKDEFKQTRIYKSWRKVDNEIHSYLKKHSLTTVKVPISNPYVSGTSSKHINFNSLLKANKLPRYAEHVNVPVIIHHKRAKIQNAKIDKYNKHVTKVRNLIKQVKPLAPSLDRIFEHNHQYFINHFDKMTYYVNQNVQDANYDVENSLNYRSKSFNAISSKASSFYKRDRSLKSSLYKSFVVNHTSYGHYANSVAHMSGLNRINGMNTIAGSNLEFLRNGIRSVAWTYANNKSISLSKSKSIMSSASASTSASRASSASSSISEFKRTSSAMRLPYWDWKYSLSEAHLLSNKAEATFLSNIGNHRSRKYTGSCGYVNPSYENKSLNFNSCYDLERGNSIFANSVASSKSNDRIRHHDHGQGWSR